MEKKELPFELKNLQKDKEITLKITKEADNDNEVAGVQRANLNELALYCYNIQSGVEYGAGTVCLGYYIGNTLFVDGYISYDDVLKSRGISKDAVEECFLTLYGAAGDDYSGTYDILSENSELIGTYAPEGNKYRIPLKKIYDVSGSSNFAMIPEMNSGSAIFNESDYTIEIEIKEPSANFSNEPDYKQNYFEGDVANAGNYAVNTHNGRLSFSKTLFALDGNRLPMSLRMVYNPFTQDGISGIFSEKWKFNIEQFVFEKDGGYIYIDNEYRSHIFKQLSNSSGNNVSGKYYDTAHSGLLLQVNGGTVIITNDRQSELKFQDGRLVEIKECVGSGTYNTLTVSYNNGIVSSVTDGMGRVTAFAKSGNIITVTLPSQDTISITENSTSGNTEIRDVDSRIYKYSYTVSSGIKLLSEVSAERKSVQFVYTSERRIKTVTEKLPNITVAENEFTYDVYANLTDVKTTEYPAQTPKKSVITRYAMDDAGRLIYSCELQDDKSYAVVFRAKEDYNTYSAALTGLREDAFFNIVGDEYIIEAGQSANELASTSGSLKAVDGEDGFLIANVKVEATEESDEEVPIYITYGFYGAGYEYFGSTTVRIKMINAVQTIIARVSRKLTHFEDFNYNEHKIFYFTSGKCKYRTTIGNLGYYVADVQENAECINKNTGGAENFIDPCDNTVWYKLEDTKIVGVTGSNAVKMTSEDWLASLDNYARNHSDYIVWYNERTEAKRFTGNASFVFGNNTYAIDTIRYATVTEQGINTVYDAYTFNGSPDAEYIKESKTIARSQSFSRAQGSNGTCYLYYDKYYRQTKAVDSEGMETLSGYDNYGNLTSAVTKNGSLNIKENYTYGNAAGIAGTGEYLVSADRYMQAETLSDKYAYEQNTGRLKKSTTPINQSTDYTYEKAGELKTLSSMLYGIRIENSLTYNAGRLQTAKHNDFSYGFTYGTTYEELQTVTAGTYKLCDQKQTSGRVLRKNYQTQYKTYTTDRYGRQSEITLNYTGYQATANYKYGLPNQTGTDNAQSKLLEINFYENYSTGTAEYNAYYNYEANGNLKSVDWYGFYTLTYSYDDENRVSTQSYSAANETLTTEYMYLDGDALTEPRIKKTTIKSRATTISTTADEYDVLKRLTSRTKTFGARADKETYSYVSRTVNGTGTTYLPSSVNHSLGSAYNEAFTYDKNGNITGINRNGGKVTYEYDNFNRLIRENNPQLNKTYVYEYNKGGNITSKKEYAYTTGTVGTPTFSSDYSYGNAYKDLLTTYNGKQITYDGTGRPTSYKGKTLSWTLGNLGKYGEMTFGYMYDNSRMYKSSGTRNVSYRYNEGRLMGETRTENGVNKVIAYLYDQAGITGFTLNGEAYSYIKNLQGDIIAIYKGTAKVAEYAYDAWGNCTIIQDVNGIGSLNAIRYRGYYYDVETGLYYLLTRYYDPETGRFISPDDVSYLDPETMNGLNLFAYCNNNPVMNIDPSGTSWLIALAILAIMLFTPIGGTAVQTVASVGSFVGMAVASIWDEEIREDMNAIHWNPFNSDESAVLSSSKVSFYKGVPVYLINDMGGSMSLGAIFFDKSQGGEVLKHERGHNTQLMCMGLGNYLFQIGIPSMWKNNVNNPWELSASMLGGSALANSSTETQKTNAVNYFILSSIVGLNISTIIWYLLA